MKTKGHIRYKLQDGTIVPGVTTILNVLNKPALIQWANNLGLNGIDSTKYVDALAGVGTLAHAMVAHEFGGPEVDTSEYSQQDIEMAENSLLSFYNWRYHHDVQPIMVEQPLVHETYHYGGTIDCVATIDGVLTLIDIKTGKNVWPEHIHQLAAYNELLIANGTVVESARILRIGREASEGFDERVYPIDGLVDHMSIFKACLEIHGLQKKLR